MTLERTDTIERSETSGELIRSLTWRGAFWVAAGVPPLVLFSLGGIAGVAGKMAFAVWMISMVMGFLQSFTYAEMAGMFGEKSGGASVYGATAWLRYSKPIAALSVWCNWCAWSPVLSLGCAIAAGYILNAFYPIPAADSQAVLDWLAGNVGATAEDAVAALTPAVRTWSAYDLTVPGLGTLYFNATFLIGAMLMLIIFAIQQRGIESTATAQKWLAIIVLVPLFLVGIIPILNGSIVESNVTGLVPPAAAYSAEDGEWNIGGWTLVLGGLYIAAWSTYAFETAVCYTRELRDPARDTFKAIFFTGILCVVFFFLIPFSFQGVFGHEGMLAPGIVDGTGIAEALGSMVGAGRVVTQIFVILMILALFLAIMTAMAGSSRTLYQGSKDGWLPRYLSRTNDRGAPTGAMWTGFVFSLVLLALASDVAGYFYVLAISNVGYLIFSFLNLNAGWIHRVDSPHLPRPWKAPTVIIGINTVLAFINAIFLGAGAKVWGYSGALWAGLVLAGLIIPVFLFRHYVQDRGRFPRQALIDLGLPADGSPSPLGAPRAGLLPYLALALGAVLVIWANWFFVLPA